MFKAAGYFRAADFFLHGNPMVKAVLNSRASELVELASVNFTR